MQVLVALLPEVPGELAVVALNLLLLCVAMVVVVVLVILAVVLALAWSLAVMDSGEKKRLLQCWGFM
jgi:hypothetical protein